MNDQGEISHYQPIFMTGKIPADNITLVSSNQIYAETDINATELFRIKNDRYVIRITKLSEKGYLTFNDWICMINNTPLVIFRYMACYSIIKLCRGEFKIEIWTIDDKEHPFYKISGAINYAIDNRLVNFYAGKAHIDSTNLIRQRKNPDADLESNFLACIEMGIITRDRDSINGIKISKAFFDQLQQPCGAFIEVEGKSVPTS